MRRLFVFTLTILCAPLACGERRHDGEGATASSATTSVRDAGAASASVDAIIDGAASQADASTATASKPQLSTKQQSTWIWEKPRYDSQQIGYFRAGSRLARAAEPYEGKDAQPCGGKWYAVVPLGYVCEGKDGATVDLDDPRVAAAAAHPPKDEPLPYAYGMSFASPMYARVPTPQEQKDSEGDVEYWRKTIAAVRAKTPREKLGPELAMPVGEMPAFLAGHAQAPAIMPWLVPNKTARAGYALPSTRLAFVAAFESEGRNFYLTSELTVVPTDRFKVAHAQDFRGVELGDANADADAGAGEHLPMIWVRYPTDKQPVFVYELRGESLAKTTTQLALQSHFEVAQTDVTVKGVRHHELTRLPPGLEAKDDVRYVVRATDVTRVNAVKAAPDGVGADEYWIDVDLGRQALVAYRGATPTYVTLVSSGAGGKGHVTPFGTFRIYQKHWTARMSADEKPPEKEGEEAERSYRFDDVPWVQYLFAGIALHAAFWHDNFGQPRSHGCINLSPYDARYLFKRTSPALPEAWHGINGGRAGVPLGTLVVVHG